MLSKVEVVVAVRARAVGSSAVFRLGGVGALVAAGRLIAIARRFVAAGLLAVVWLSIAAAGLVSCGGSGVVDSGNTLVVSIEPLRFIVDEIVGDDFEVSVLVPPGASPETYEPTPQQIEAVERARLVFSTGLIGFETVMLARLSTGNVGPDGSDGSVSPADSVEPGRFVDLSVGIELISGSSLHHVHGKSDTRSPSHSHGGVDPHIWTSPKALAQMAATAYERIHEAWPDSASYTANYTRLAERLAHLDREVSGRIRAWAESSADAGDGAEIEAETGVEVGTGLYPPRSFLIFHPGLTYFARDYGLRQIALENDGKEPSARQLAEAIALARAEGITKVLYQNEFPRRSVEVVAAGIGAEPVEIDILGNDIMGNILKITGLITDLPARTSNTPAK